MLFLHHNDKHTTTTEIDKIVSAKIPDLSKKHLVYDVLKQLMVHGPCGSINSKASCIIENNRDNWNSKQRALVIGGWITIYSMQMNLSFPIQFNQNQYPCIITCYFK